MVWREHGNGPTYPHHSKESAELDAQRLAAANPGHVFYVLKAVTGAYAAPPQTERVKVKGPLSDDLIPF